MSRNQNQQKGVKKDHSNKHNNREQAKIAVTVAPKPKKEKTPAGHFKFNGKCYKLETEGMPKVKLFCKFCRKETAKLVGSFKDKNGETHYVVKCPWHFDQQQVLKENEFQQQYPGILPNDSSESPQSTLTPEGYPTQKSFCRCHGYHSGKIIGESENGFKWKIRCLVCGAEWLQSKEMFAKKYIGVDGNPPDYVQREAPEYLLESYLNNEPFQNNLGALLNGIQIPDKPLDAKIQESEQPSELLKQAEENSSVSTPETTNEKEEPSKKQTVQLNGINITIPKGMTLKYEVNHDGQVMISITQ